MLGILTLVGILIAAALCVVAPTVYPTDPGLFSAIVAVVALLGVVIGFCLAELARERLRDRR